MDIVFLGEAGTLFSVSTFIWEFMLNSRRISAYLFTSVPVYTSLRKDEIDCRSHFILEIVIRLAVSDFVDRYCFSIKFRHSVPLSGVDIPETERRFLTDDKKSSFI